MRGNYRSVRGVIADSSALDEAYRLVMRRKLSLRIVVLCGCIVCAAVMPVPAALAQSNANDAGLTVLGTSTRTVALPRAGKEHRRGLLTVVFHNSTVEPGILQLKFFATTTGTTVQLTNGSPKPSDVVHLVPLRPNLWLAAGDSTQVTLAIQLSRDQPLQDADGMLFARMVPVPHQPTRKDPPSTQVHVFATLGTASFLPNPVKLQVKEGCWFSGTCGDSTEATLQGPDARALLFAAPSGDAVLSNTAGQTIQATVDDLTGTGNIVRARIRVTGLAFGRVGTFTGEIGLGPSPERGPSVDITAGVGVWFGWLVVFLFAGSLIGGFFSLSARIWRRRRLLKLEVEEAIARYRARLTASLVQRRTENEPWVPYSYDLTPVLGREVRDAVNEQARPVATRSGRTSSRLRAQSATRRSQRSPAGGREAAHYLMAGRSSAPEDTADNAIQAAMEPFPAERGVPSLLWHLGTARTDADFTDDAAVAHELIDCVDRWHDVEETCAVVHEVLKSLDDADAKQRHPPEAKGGRRFQDACPVAIHDLRVLRARAHELLLQGKRDELDKAADDLVRRINRQLLVLLQLRLIWTMDSILDDAGYWDPREVTTRELRRGEREKRSAEALDAQKQVRGGAMQSRQQPRRPCRLPGKGGRVMRLVLGEVRQARRLDEGVRGRVRRLDTRRAANASTSSPPARNAADGFSRRHRARAKRRSGRVTRSHSATSPGRWQSHL